MFDGRDRKPRVKTCRAGQRAMIFQALMNHRLEALCSSQVGCGETFGESRVNWPQQCSGFFALSLRTPQASEAAGAAQFPGECVLSARAVKSIDKIALC